MPDQVKKMMHFSEFHFLRPYWLLALLPWLSLTLLLWKNKLNRGNWSQVCDAALLPYILQEKHGRHNRWPLITGAIAAFLTILALAGPVWERLPSPVFRNEAALVIILDLSRSMDAADIKPSRLSRARYKIADILKRRQDGQTALIVYAGDAFTVTPLTDDTATITSQLSALTTSIMPIQGSDAHQALELAAALFKQTGLQRGQILLVTDGVNMERTLPTVEALGNYQLSVLGVGTADGAPIKTPGGGFLQDNAGDIVIPQLNSAELRRLAQAGGGQYQTLSANDSDIEKLLSVINQQSTQQSSEQDSDLLLEHWQERAPWLLLLILPLAALTFRRGII